MLSMLLVTAVAFGLIMLLMSVGVLVSGRCLRGSCGGPDILDSSGQSLKCATCPNRDRPPAELERPAA